MSDGIGWSKTKLSPRPSTWWKSLPQTVSHSAGRLLAGIIYLARRLAFVFITLLTIV